MALVTTTWLSHSLGIPRAALGVGHQLVSRVASQGEAPGVGVHSPTGRSRQKGGKQPASPSGKWGLVPRRVLKIGEQLNTPSLALQILLLSYFYLSTLRRTTLDRVLKNA